MLWLVERPAGLLPLAVPIYRLEILLSPLEIPGPLQFAAQRNKK